MTMFSRASSGGTHLSRSQHRHLWHYPGIRHSVLVPGASYRQANGIHEVPALPLPFGNGYRFLSVAAPGARSCAICNRT